MRGGLKALLPVRADQRTLVWELIRRELAGKYRGTGLGALWALATPLLMLLVYTLAFGHLARAQWPGLHGLGEFALWVFAGLAVHAAFAECLARAPALVTAQPNYVTRVRFPLALLAWPVLASALFHLAMNLLVLLLALALRRGGLPPTLLALPLVLLPLLPLLLGLLWSLGALGVYLRDLGQLVAPLATAALLLSSALVPPAAVPAGWRWLFLANPLTTLIDQLRRVLFLGQWPQWPQLAGYALLALLFALLAQALFRRLQAGFADVL
ncbi:ABC transporter permease [Thermomonas sp. S9]|uniref:ABC transporter permease n=1 Tax=unclassified Thermomonas TaxID=2633315 RepID=UPI001AC787A0|nr:ABC transporter permease [Thermomonas sp. S9]MBN8716068.1 ABC transporter permease [Xanthomonadales bacterium]MBN8767776.1 ABC transporter permease [Stenotrophomonas sp.]MCR6494908.1 ABC transporter permease [Thermomonas sp. S9]